MELTSTQRFILENWNGIQFLLTIVSILVAFNLAVLIPVICWLLWKADDNNRVLLNRVEHILHQLQDESEKKQKQSNCESVNATNPFAKTK